MTTELLPKIQSDITLLLKEDKEWDEDLGTQRYEALTRIRALSQPEKEKLNNYVLQWLANPKSKPNSWQRAWAISTLAQLGCNDGEKYVKEHMLVKEEEHPWTRHFALINAANFDPFPEAEIRVAAEDVDVLPQATALRLLIANDFSDYEENLQNMLKERKNPRAHWAAARALRTRPELRMRPLSPDSERMFIPLLVDIASNKYEPLDARWECVQALTSFSVKKMVASQVADLLMRDMNKDATMRRYFLDALVELKQADEAKAALLKSVEDDDAQIREKAAGAIKNMYKTEETIKELVSHACTSEKNSDRLLEALRRIDNEQAAKTLRDALNNPDTRISRQANILLIDLGGQMATQILLGERTKALDRYTRILTSADYEVRQHFGQLMSQARSAFWISQAMHTTIFLIGVAALTGSLMLALSGGENKVATWASATVGVASLILTTFYQTPLRNVRGSMNALMQVDVVFMGYVRQINQIDATFKHLFLETQDFGTDSMKATVTEIQNAVDKVLTDIEKHLLEKK